MTAATAQRSKALDRSLNLEILKFDAATETLRQIDTKDAGNLEYTFPRLDNQEALLAVAWPGIVHVMNLVSEASRVIEAVSLPGTNEVALRFRGLEFARWNSGVVRYGLGNTLRTLTRGRVADLAKLIRELLRYRSPESTKTAHHIYRAAPERWMETHIIAAPDCLDASLDPKYLYSQLMSAAGADRGVADLLGVTRQGRLALIELKASEDIQLPLQALDYWLRVSRHHADGDFQRLGYLRGVILDPRPPVLWLVAPGFQFHSSTGLLLNFASPEAEISQIGLNENWRKSLMVIFRR